MSVTVSARLVDRGLIARDLPSRGVTGHAGERAAPTDAGLPVCAELRQLLPWRGLRRGATVAVAGDAPGTTSLFLALIAEPVRAGSWCAVAGVPALGACAAAELGADLRRLALVPDPGEEWAAVVAALLDGMDIVVVRPQGAVTPPVARRLAARARQRGSVLVARGEGWEGADVVLRVAGQVWHGLGAGRGRLVGRELTVVSHGRGAATRRRSATLRLPPALHHRGQHVLRPAAPDALAALRPTVTDPMINEAS